MIIHIIVPRRSAAAAAAGTRGCGGWCTTPIISITIIAINIITIKHSIIIIISIIIINIIIIIIIIIIFVTIVITDTRGLRAQAAARTGASARLHYVICVELVHYVIL